MANNNRRQNPNNNKPMRPQLISGDKGQQPNRRNGCVNDDADINAGSSSSSNLQKMDDFESWALEDFDLCQYIGEDSTPIDDTDVEHRFPDDLKARRDDFFYEQQQYHQMFQDTRQPHANDNYMEDSNIHTPYSAIRSGINEIKAPENDDKIRFISLRRSSMGNINSQTHHVDSVLPIITTDTDGLTNGISLLSEAKQWPLPIVLSSESQIDFSVVPVSTSNLTVIKTEPREQIIVGDGCVDIYDQPGTSDRERSLSRPGTTGLPTSPPYFVDDTPKMSERIQRPGRPTSLELPSSGEIKKPRKYHVKPENEKQNPVYKVKRAKNNDAVRRSRDKAKRVQEFKEERLSLLENENLRQKKQIEQLEMRNEFLEKELIRIKQNCTCRAGSVRVIRGRLEL